MFGNVCLATENVLKSVALDDINVCNASCNRKCVKKSVALDVINVCNASCNRKCAKTRCIEFYYCLQCVLQQKAKHTKSLLTYQHFTVFLLSSLKLKVKLLLGLAGIIYIQ